MPRRYFAILRILPVNTHGDVRNIIRHDIRLRMIRNANEDKLRLNGWLMGDPDCNFEEVFEKKIKSFDDMRSNARIGVHFFLGASPGFFRPHKPEKYGVYVETIKTLFEKKCIEWLTSRFSSIIILYAVSHLDEGTPHVSALGIPVDPFGNLNYERLFGGDGTLMTEFQTDFANIMMDLGLVRGRLRSSAYHQKIGIYYELTNKEIIVLPPLLSMPVKPVMPEVGFIKTTDEKLRMSQYKNDIMVYEKELIRVETTNKSILDQAYTIYEQAQYKANHHDFLKEENDRLLDVLEKMSAETEALKKELGDHRVTNIAAMIETYFGPMKSEDKDKFNGKYKYFIGSNKKIMTINKNEWKIEGTDIKGNGAVSLLSEMLDPGNKSSGHGPYLALEFLARIYGRPQAIQDYAYYLKNKSDNKIVTLPTPALREEKDWIRTREVLEKIYHFDSSVVEKLRTAGSIGVDYVGNLFALYESRQTYYLRSVEVFEEESNPRPRFTKVVTSKAEDIFRPTKKKPRVLIVKCPYDALAAMTIDPELEVICFHQPTQKYVDETLTHAEEIIWGIAIETDEINYLSKLVNHHCTEFHKPLVTVTKLSLQKRYKSWSRLLKSNAALAASGAIPEPPPIKPKTPAPNLRPVRYPRPKGY